MLASCLNLSARHTIRRDFGHEHYSGIRPSSGVTEQLILLDSLSHRASTTVPSGHRQYYLWLIKTDASDHNVVYAIV